MGDFLENIRVAWDGLASNRMRSILTMLGIIIGVASVVALLSIGQGAQSAITGQISSIGSNLLFVSPGMVRSEGVQTAGGGGLTMDDAKAVADPANVPDAAFVAPVVSRNAQVVQGSANINAGVAGVTPAYLNAFDLEVARGRFINNQDLTGRTMVAVLGPTAAENLFGGLDPLGQTIKVALPGDSGGRVSLTVVGLLVEKGGSMMSDTDGAVLVPLTSAQTKIFDARNARGQITVSSINVVAVSEDRAQAAGDEITALLRQRHRIGAGEEDDFSVTSQADILDVANQVTSILTTFLAAIAGISLLVGGIGIMNIMLVSVTERTREIGIRKAVGARKADILIQFLLEAIVLSLLGGVIGILLGAGLSALVGLTGVLHAVVTFSSVALAVGFSLAVGLFFGLYPANRAAKLEPIEALRYE